MEDAEDIKLTYSHIGVREGDRYERIRYTYEPDGSEKVVACEELVNIVEARAAELLMYIKQYVFNPDNWLQRAVAGIVITGGGTNMKVFRELAQADNCSVFPGASRFASAARPGSLATADSGGCNGYRCVT